MTRRLPVRTYCEKAPLFFRGRKKGLLWWHTTVTAKPKTSRQKQKHRCKTKNLTAKTKYLTAKPKTSRQKQNTSRQNQILHSKSKIALVLPRGIWFLLWSISCWFCREVFSFAVWILVLPWGFWFCCEVFGFAVRFSVLPWGQLVFAVRLLVLPWQLASPQTSLGARLSRIHDKRTPKDVCGEATWQWDTVKEDRTRQQSLPAKPRLPPLIRDWEIIKKTEIPLSLPSPVVKRIWLIFFRW